MLNEVKHLGSIASRFEQNEIRRLRLQNATVGGRRWRRSQEILTMQRVAFRLWVQPDRLDEYKRLHQEVWPELLADMRAAGIRNYSIFADGPELFGYLECDDWESTSAALAQSDANRRWQEFMQSYLATPVDPDAPEPLRMMDEVFRME
jgi:L-rhamnose mutarotase